ncbi:hypothetical protein AUEXF2481DRAFT_512234 [Aureobasidium subglaciale EXF-2481]|uniref:Uncharacterized protein n=1 Tax=Aureobasidium subglaciale (strain EXF-2481) TaxID=1043005 RepID=A0A074Y5H4_AURSE|nr:uncharacterized protein AUEXF2481DRAFT_512234 [Aureobasidium subglaciale EXF-2481]KAI5207255.1 hypothetical protein E4T38_03503 [Aureobasidium subglaciale]KAI5226135.1 hypothetical protein E4T40_03119 [Aureobasidium subglaciale]KAI5229528.1 hypothetical protein E4T41_03500 [Aureobasidium subglaciale]KAI5264137.1 hypothetical protein E4T46_03277 [Aureobasidium subglaciale]KEQ91189.1 hypothetical protein AUEXF2481DRAFT_512234 [Aureobasidium subglaciale EXF-2481]
MNNHPTFTPSTPTPLEYSLFSPSKAAEQQRLQEDWTYIHSFLRQIYPPPAKVPKFEENEETLKALLALANANEKADEGWSVFCAVERLGVEELEREEETQTLTKDRNTSILTTLHTSLSNSVSLNLTSHAKTAVILNSTATSPTTLATSILTLSSNISSLQHQLSTLETLTTTLTLQTCFLDSELKTLTSPSFKAEKSLPQKTLETLRQTKLLKAKIGEYDQRLLRNSSSSSIPEALLSSVESARAEVERLQKRVRGVEDGISVYEGVAPEPREVRRQMQELRRELEGWVERRDELFESMVAGRR